MKKLFKVIYRIVYIGIKFRKKIVFNDDTAEFIVWSPHFFTLRFFHGDNFPKTIALYKSLREKDKSVSIYTRKNIGKFNHKKIFIIGSNRYNIYRFENHADILFHIANQLEKQKNLVFPSLEQMKFWENKIHMHQKFKKLTIKTPKSILIKDISEITKNRLRYPFLIKEPHSCNSQGLYKITSQSDLTNFIKQNKITSELIIQELLNIRKDLRVVLIGQEIVLHYWRINPSPQWRPTPIEKGISVDFVSFPERWRKHIINTFLKLNLDNGAFDIAWQNDDLTTYPYFLEVSPFYQPNPPPEFDLTKFNYSDWKTSFTLRNNYNKAIINTIFTIQKKYVDFIINKNKF